MSDSVPSSADVVIVGGAAIGSSIACHLALDPTFDGRILVVEKDPTYAKAASALSAASIRQQFSTAVNIRISLYGIHFLRHLDTFLSVDGEAPVIDLVEGGYLYLASGSGPRDAGAVTLHENHRIQTAEGADIALFDRAGLARQFPWLNVEDLACGSWGRTGEGWFDGWALMQAYRRKARSLDVRYLADEVVDVCREGRTITGVTLRTGQTVACGTLINAAGANGQAIAALAGVDIPVVPKKRYVFTFHCRQALERVPLLIDPSGAWCRPEGRPDESGQMFIGSIAPCDGEPDPPMDENDFTVDPHLFEDKLWPLLAHRIPAFEEIRPGRAWAGPYDMNLFDHNAILGPVEGIDNLLLANGFSGHGLQQSPAVGRGLAEWVVYGSYRTLDLSDLGFDRIARGCRVLEKCII